MTFSLFMDVLVAILLAATIVYAALLNRRLQSLRSHKTELEMLIRGFNEACARAETGVRTLRSATDEATRLQQYLERSQNLRDDLAYLVERGSALADRLEGGVRTARNESTGRPGAADASAPAAASARPTAAAVRGADRAADRIAERVAERVVERAAELPERIERPERPERAERPQRAGRDRPALRAAMAAFSASGESAEPAVEEVPGMMPRSKAERELLQALRAKR